MVPPSLVLTDPIMSQCPCGLPRPYDECCGPVIAGRPAATAEALMRSRYVAFVRGEMAHLEATLAPEKMDEFDRAEVEASAAGLSGLGLDVRATAGGGEEDDAGTVEYVARFKVKGQPHAHHELASFRREQGRWVYADGQMNPKSAPRQAGKVGRNDPCPCGSGKKYKKCCGG
jgi:SEC-C motif-containing protein